MREFKFRVWDNVDYLSSPFTMQDLQSKKVQFTTDCLVLQYTGLKDKQGKEIYEGDIVKENNGRTTGKVVFVNGSFCSINEFERRLIPALFYGDAIDGINANFYEVIGNIYENPELLINKTVPPVTT